MHRNARVPRSEFTARSLIACLSVATTTAVAAASTPGNSATYQAECGSCHTAFPARLLAPAEWTRVLATLDKHYGTDATLDATALAAVARHLGASTGPTTATAATPLPRITRSRWFLEEHDEIPAATFASPAVHSAANCSACHGGAERGDFSEHSVRIPK